MTKLKNYKIKRFKFRITTLMLLILLTACSSNEDKAQKAARRFSITWQQKDWNALYDLFGSLQMIGV